jgi:hypothetical protein
MQNIEILFLSVAFSIAVFLLLREVFCWYFKINQRIVLLSDIKDELVKANSNTYGAQSSAKNRTGVQAFEHGGVIAGKAKSESFWRPE